MSEEDERKKESKTLKNKKRKTEKKKDGNLTKMLTIQAKKNQQLKQVEAIILYNNRSK
jgi:hypothetical protein